MTLHRRNHHHESFSIRQYQRRYGGFNTTYYAVAVPVQPTEIPPAVNTLALGLVASVIGGFIVYTLVKR